MSSAASASCPHCSGRGWVIHADGGAGTALPCECRRREVGPRLLAASGIPSRYASCTLEKFDTDHDVPGVAAQLSQALFESQQYVDEFIKEDGSFRENGLLYIGTVGAGKTHLATAVLKEVIRRYHRRGRFVEFTALIHEIQATFDPTSSASKRQILDPIVEADILVLDELGAQKPTPWVRDILYLIINSRYTARRPTLFTTNYPLDEDSSKREFGFQGVGAMEPLNQRISSSLVSRLREMTKMVSLNSATDYRSQVLSGGAGRR